MNGAVLVGLAPWLVMVVAVRSTGVSLALGALLAGITAGLAVLAARRQGSSAWFETVSLATFAALALVGSIAPTSTDTGLDHYGRVITASALTAIALGSLAFRPLTAQYTRDLVPARVLATPAFTRASRLDTALWGATALAVALSFLVATGVHGPLAQTTFNWLLPLALSLGCGRLLARRWTALEALEALEDSASLLVAALDVAAPGTGPYGDGRPPRRQAGLRLVLGERAEHQG